MKGRSIPERKTAALVAGLIALLTVAVYLPALGNGFVNWDDNLYIYNNTHIRSLDGRFFHWAFTTFYAANWHPLTWISHAVDYALWGLDPLGHHLTGIVLHGLNTFLVVLLASKLLTVFRERSGAAFPDERSTLIAAGVTGLLFGIHPLHVESVAWVSERKDLLCAFFYLMSLLAYADFARDPGKGGTGSYVRRPYLRALLYFALALLSKPMAVSLPVVLLILDWHPFGRLSSRTELRGAVVEKLPFFFLGAASAVVTMMSQTVALWTVAPPVVVRLLVAAHALIAYLGKMIAPVELLPFYPYARGLSYYLTFGYLFTAALVLGITVVCVWRIRKERLWSAAWGYYVLTLLPVLGIIQAGPQSMADRYTYLPSLGPFCVVGVAAAWGWARVDLLGRNRALARAVVCIGAILLVSALSAVTIGQTRVWQNSIALWSHVIEKEPEHVPLAYNNRATAYEEQGRKDLALADFDAALSLRPDYAEALMGRAELLRESGETEQALADYNKAISLRPTAYAAYMGRGLLLRQIGWLDQAKEDYDTAIALSPYTGEAYRVRGDLALQRNDRQGAVDDYRAACERDDGEGCDALRRIEAQQGGHE